MKRSGVSSGDLPRIQKLGIPRTASGELLQSFGQVSLEGGSSPLLGARATQGAHNRSTISLGGQSSGSAKAHSALGTTGTLHSPALSAAKSGSQLSLEASGACDWLMDAGSAGSLTRVSSNADVNPATQSAGCLGGSLVGSLVARKGSTTGTGFRRSRVELTALETVKGRAVGKAEPLGIAHESSGGGVEVTVPFSRAPEAALAGTGGFSSRASAPVPAGAGEGALGTLPSASSVGLDLAGAAQQQRLSRPVRFLFGSFVLGTGCIPSSCSLHLFASYTRTRAHAKHDTTTPPPPAGVPTTQKECGSSPYARLAGSVVPPTSTQHMGLAGAAKPCPKQGARLRREAARAHVHSLETEISALTTELSRLTGHRWGAWSGGAAALCAIGAGSDSESKRGGSPASSSGSERRSSRSPLKGVGEEPERDAKRLEQIGFLEGRGGGGGGVANGLNSVAVVTRLAALRRARMHRDRGLERTVGNSSSTKVYFPFAQSSRTIHARTKSIMLSLHEDISQPLQGAVQSLEALYLTSRLLQQGCSSSSSSSSSSKSSSGQGPSEEILWLERMRGYSEASCSEKAVASSACSSATLASPTAPSPAPSTLEALRGLLNLSHSQATRLGLLFSGGNCAECAPPLQPLPPIYAALAGRAHAPLCESPCESPKAPSLGITQIKAGHGNVAAAVKRCVGGQPSSEASGGLGAATLEAGVFPIIDIIGQSLVCDPSVSPRTAALLMCWAQHNDAVISALPAPQCPASLVRRQQQQQKSHEQQQQSVGLSLSPSPATKTPSLFPPFLSLS